METNSFEIRPLVVPADTESRITITCGAGGAPGLLEAPSLLYVRDDGLQTDGQIAMRAFSPVAFRTVGDSLEITLFFAGEAEHTLRLFWEGCDGQPDKVVDLHVYSLHPDLFGLRPFKGDFHAHSTCSDGCESPEHVAANERKAGMDFFALTDHRLREPSLRVITFISSLPTDFRCYPGEEIHPTDTPAHIVSFGASASISEEYAEPKNAGEAPSASLARYRNQVAARTAELPAAPDTIRQTVAAAEWCFDRIRELGGVAIHCHPYWRPAQRFNMPEAANTLLLARARFDAVEAANAYSRGELEANALAIARFHEERMMGRRLSAVGTTDTHWHDRYGWAYTIALAESAEFTHIAQSIRERRSLAVSAIPDAFPIVTGDFRLVKYAYFLLREFFPQHDRLCQLEGEAILQHLAGDTGAIERLSAMQDAVASHRIHAWAE